MGGPAGDTDGVEADMELAGISGWADRRLDTLSDGMAQRVMVARAAIQSRQVLILDGRRPSWMSSERRMCSCSSTACALRAAPSFCPPMTWRPWRPGRVSHWLHLHPGQGEGSTLHVGGFDADVVRSALRETGR